MPGGAARVRGAFEAARVALLCRTFGLSDRALGEWLLASAGDLGEAAELVTARPWRARRWLPRLHATHPGRFAQLVPVTWSRPNLYPLSYHVLDAVRPGWAALLPALAPAGTRATVEHLVRAGEGLLACHVLHVVRPGWLALAWEEVLDGPESGDRVDGPAPELGPSTS